MKNFRKTIALFLSMLMILAVAPISAFAEEAVVTPDAEAGEDANTETLNPFALIGKFFEAIGETLRIVIEFLQNMFAGTGNDALDQMK